MPIALPAEPPVAPYIAEPARPVELGVSFETLRMRPIGEPASESVGIVGVGYRHRIAPEWVGGLGFYGAVSGRRDGFLAWGVSGAYQREFGPWQAEAGLFVGGGGGGPPWVGSGLMLRPSAELAYFWGDVGLGLGVSHVRFPDGQVSSSQLYGALKWRGSGYFGPAGGGAAAANAGLAAQAMPAEYAALVGSYRMRDGSPHKDGIGDAADMRYAGFVWRRGLSGSLLGGQPHALLSAVGAASGGYDGYAEFLAGAGIQWPVVAIPALRLRAELAAGMAGAGAAVDTGGGIVGKATGGAAWQIGSNVSLALMGGLLESRGRLKASEWRLELAHTGWEAVPGATRPAGTAAPAVLAWAPWELSAGVVAQARMPRTAAASVPTGPVDVLALKGARELGGGWRAVGQAATAVNGDAGGYAAGTFGIGWLSAPLAAGGLRIGGETQVGAAGGGLVSVSGGALWQAQVQARYPLSRDWSVQLDAGGLRTFKGALSTPLLGLSAVYSFSRLEGLAAR
jgi:hypothetical protein